MNEKEFKELIIFIPGISMKYKQEEYLEKLIVGISHFCSDKNMHSEELGGTKENEFRKFKIILDNGITKFIDFKEIYWSDLCPILSSESIYQKIGQGFSLLIFWISSINTWKQVGQSKYLIFNTIFTASLILCWYYGALATAFTAIGANPEIFQTKLPEEVASFFQSMGKNMGGYYIWFITSIFVGLFRVTEILNTTYAVKAYLKNWHSLFHKISGRIEKNLALKSNSLNNYERITILSHSFGVVVSTEVLANYKKENLPKIRYITLGGPLLFISAHSKRVKSAIKDVIDNNKVESWTDFYSENDWFCTYSPIPKNDIKYKNYKITSTASLDDKITGESHNLYFEDWDVIRTLLG